MGSISSYNIDWVHRPEKMAIVMLVYNGADVCGTKAFIKASESFKEVAASGNRGVQLLKMIAGVVEMSKTFSKTRHFFSRKPCLPT